MTNASIIIILFNQISLSITKDLVTINKLLLEKIELHGHFLSEISNEDSRPESCMKYAQLRSAVMSRHCQLTRPINGKDIRNFLSCMKKLDYLNLQ